MSRTNGTHREAALRRIRDVINRLASGGSAVAPDGTVHSLFPVAVTAAEGSALRERVMREGANRTIEIGLGYGLSALFICEALLANGDVAAHHVVVDPNQTTRFANCGLQFLDEAGVIHLVEFQKSRRQSCRSF